MAVMEGGEAFEAALRQDLPRGLEKQARAVGRDRGLTARWLGPDEMTGAEWQAQGGILLGYRSGQVVGWKDDRHILTIAGSRAGKGVSLIIPNLIFYEGSAVVIDPKGENAARTAGRRGKGTRSGGAGLGQDVHVLDPFGDSGMPTASFNPLQRLNARPPDVVEDIGLFADARLTRVRASTLAIAVSFGRNSSCWRDLAHISASAALRACLRSSSHVGRAALAASAMCRFTASFHRPQPRGCFLGETGAAFFARVDQPWPVAGVRARTASKKASASKRSVSPRATSRSCVGCGSMLLSLSFHPHVSMHAASRVRASGAACS